MSKTRLGCKTWDLEPAVIIQEAGAHTCSNDKSMNQGEPLHVSKKCRDAGMQQKNRKKHHVLAWSISSHPSRSSLQEINMVRTFMSPEPRPRTPGSLFVGSTIGPAHPIRCHSFQLPSTKQGTETHTSHAMQTRRIVEQIRKGEEWRRHGG